MIIVLRPPGRPVLSASTLVSAFAFLPLEYRIDVEDEETVSLNREQIEAYHTLGYLCGLPGLQPEEIAALLERYHQWSSELDSGVKMRDLAQWEKENVYVLERVCCHPRILSTVESLIGPEF